MPTNYTTSLGLALPATGELSGSWGDTVNNGITSLVEDAVAGTTTLSSDADVTLTTTSGAANQARAAVIRWTAGGSVTRTITAPANSKLYVVINATSGSQSIKICGPGPTTGVTVVPGSRVAVVWNGTDFVLIDGGVTAAVWGGTGQSSYAVGDLLYASTTTALSKLAGVATGNVLRSGGVSTAPAWGKVDLTTDVTGSLPGTNGGTGNGFFAVTGPTTSTKTFTFPNASATVLTSNAAVTVGQGGTGATTLTGVLKGNGTSAFTAASAGTDYTSPSGTENLSNKTFTSNLAFNGTALRITGDFSNATLNSRLLFQSSTTNGETHLGAVPNGTATAVRFTAYNAATPTNSAIARMQITSTAATFETDVVGSGSAVPLRLAQAGTTRLEISTTGRFQVTAPQDGNITAMGALDIDCSTANYFTKTISGNSTFTFSNAPSSRAFAFTLELTHTSGTVTWPTAVKWPSDIAPTLTTGKTHLFTFVTDDGGTRWRGVANVDYVN